MEFKDLHVGSPGLIEVDLKRLGHKLRSIRNSKGLTLEEVSSQLSVTPSYLSEIERGKKVPSLKVLCNLATYLNLSKSFLRGILEEPEDKTKSFGEMVASRRSEMNVTIGELSRRIEWPRKYLERVELDNSNVPEEFLSDLAEVLQLPNAFFEFPASETIGKKVKFFRCANNFTQTELAEKSGLSASLVSKVERDQVQPSLTTLSEISKALGISPCCFVFELNQNPINSKIQDPRDEKDSSLKDSKLEEIIDTLPELDKKEIEKLHEYLTKLQG